MVFAPRLFPGKAYKLVISRNHNQIVNIRSMINTFYNTYADLLVLNKKRHSSEHDLRKLMHRQGIDVEKVAEHQKNLVALEEKRLSGKLYPKKSGRAVKKASKTVSKSSAKLEAQKKVKNKMMYELEVMFKISIENLDEMLESQKRLEFSDMVLYWRHAKKLERLSKRIERSSLNEEAKFHMRHQIYEIVQSIADTIEHYWIVSKSHSRDLMELEEYTLISTRGEYLRIRIQSIHLDKLELKIKKARETFSNMLKTGSLEHFKKVKDEFHELMAEYHEEIELLHKVMHESKVLIHSTEKLFKAMGKETRTLKWEHLNKQMERVEHKIQRILLNIEAQMRRENIDLQGLARSMEPEMPKKEDLDDQK